MTNNNNLINLHNFTAGAPINPIKPVILPASVTQTQAHTSTSERYQFVNTADLIERLSGNGLVVRSASQSRSKLYDGFQKHVIRMSMPNQTVGDTKPEILIINSHNGGGSLQFRLGLFRLVCSNGLIVGSDIGRVSIRHQGNNVQQIVEDALNDLHTQLPFVAQMVESMRGKTMSLEEQASFVRQALELRGIPERAKVKNLIPMLETSISGARRAEDSGKTLWETFNKVQENLIHGVRGLRKISSPTRDIELNRDLWNLAETFINAA